MESVGSVNKGKKVYGKPMLMAEEFVPEQYAASVCYYIQCELDGYEGIWGKEDLDGDGVTGNHNPGDCKGYGNTVINVDESGKYTIYEGSNDNFVGADAVILAADYKTPTSISIEDLKSGKQLIWQTEGTTWRGDWECIHVGRPIMTGRNPNHS